MSVSANFANFVLCSDGGGCRGIGAFGGWEIAAAGLGWLLIVGPLGSGNDATPAW